MAKGTVAKNNAIKAEKTNQVRKQSLRQMRRPVMFYRQQKMQHRM